MKVLTSRLVKASLSIAACVIVAVGADAAMSWGKSGILNEAVSILANEESSPGSTEGLGEDARELVEFSAEEGGEGRIVDVLGRSSLERQVDEASQVSSSFSEEVLSVEGRADVRVGAEGSVVGFTTLSSPEVAFEEMQASLGGRGWIFVPSGNATQGSFVKDCGEITWVYVTCVGVGKTTSVVMQCAMPNAEKG